MLLFPKKYGTIYDLPGYNCGTLITEFPNCAISYCFDTIPTVNLPLTAVKNCDDFEIVGLYKTANGGERNYSMLLTNINQDSIRDWPIGYTGFQFFDKNDVPLTDMTTPGYIVPSYKELLVVHF